MKKREKKKRIILIIIGVLLSLGDGLLLSGQAVVDRIVAIVNQEIITLSEVEKLAGSYQEEIEAQDRLLKKEKIHEVYRKVLEKLIEEKLIDQEVKKAGIKVASKELEGAIEDIKRRNAVSQEEFEKALANEGFTLESFKKEIEKKLQRIKLINWYVKVEGQAGEKEWRDFYQKNIEQYRANESYHIGQILFLVPKEVRSEEIREIRKKCEIVLEKLRKGEDFGEMAFLYSEDIFAKDRGDLGYFKKGELLPEIEKEALRLKVGQISGIIRTDLGFHIIKLLGRTGDTPLPYDEVKEKVKTDYYAKEMEKSFQQFISKLKEKSVIEIKL